MWTFLIWLAPIVALICKGNESNSDTYDTLIFPTLIPYLGFVIVSFVLLHEPIKRLLSAKIK